MAGMALGIVDLVALALPIEKYSGEPSPFIAIVVCYRVSHYYVVVWSQ